MSCSFELHCAAQIDRRIAGRTPAVAMPVFSSQNHIAPAYVRNVDCWAADLDLSCISPWNDYAGVLRAGTLISPRHVLFAHHYPIGWEHGAAMVLGAVVRFVTPSGVAVDRTITAAEDLGLVGGVPDFIVALLDSDVAGCSFAKVLPSDWEDFFPANDSGGRGYGLPAFGTDQEEKAIIFDVGGGPGNENEALENGGICYTMPPTDATRYSFYESLIAGDSGNPTFLVINDELVLLTVATTAFTGSAVTAYRAEINAAMATLGGGYSLTEIELPFVPDIIANASPFWGGHDTSASDWDAVARRQFAAGCNTFTTGGSWSLVVREYEDEEDAVASCAYFANMLMMKRDPLLIAYYNSLFGAAVGGVDVTEIPITLQISISDYWPSGWDLQWNGVSGASSLFRTADIGGSTTPTDRDDPAEAGYIEVYHTGVQDEMTAQGKGLRELIGDNGNPGGVGDEVLPSWLWCPNYRGTYYDNAMAKFEQYVKWLRPVHVVMDEERFGNSAAQDGRLAAGQSVGTDLAHCSRCVAAGSGATDTLKGLSGYEAGKDSFAKAIVDLVHTYVPGATVTFYDTYSARASATTEKYGAGHYHNFGDWRSSGISTGAPSLYDLSWVADPAAEIAVQSAGAPLRWADVGYVDVPPTNESGNYGAWNDVTGKTKWWGVQPTALLGSYVWLTHCATSTMDLTDNGTYLTNTQFYDLCYALARAGAVGFYLYPGYSNTVTCANNTALDRLIPVGLDGFAAGKEELEAYSSGSSASSTSSSSSMVSSASTSSSSGTSSQSSSSMISSASASSGSSSSGTSSMSSSSGTSSLSSSSMVSSASFSSISHSSPSSSVSSSSSSMVSSASTSSSSHSTSSSSSLSSSSLSSSSSSSTSSSQSYPKPSGKSVRCRSLV